MLYGIVNVHFSFFFLFFFFFFRLDFVRPISLEPLLAETPNWVCCLVLWSSCALLLTIQFASLFFIYFYFFIFFRQDFVRAISLEPLLAETPNWVCCLVLRSNFALLLTIQFASLISSLINIISLLLTTFDWTKVRGIAPRSHTGRPRTCLVIYQWFFTWGSWPQWGCLCFLRGHKRFERNCKLNSTQLSYYIVLYYPLIEGSA